MMDYSQHINFLQTPQTSPIPGEAQVQNNAGGYGYAVDDWSRLHRFLILGTEGGTYYVGEHKLTVDNAEVVERCIRADGKRTVDLIVSISDGGRAPKNDSALFALAMATSLGNTATRKQAWYALEKVARTGTHFFTFCGYRKNSFGGFSRLGKQGIGRWLQRQQVNDLAYQMAKYQHRNGWTWRDVLRLARPQPNGIHDRLFDWACHGTLHPYMPSFLSGLKAMQIVTSVQEAAAIVSEYHLTREMVPTRYLNDPKVWRALLPNTPLTALMRNLGNLTRIGVIKPLAAETTAICQQLTNRDALKLARIHPLTWLMALKTYSSGRGMRGSGEWNPVAQVVEALETALPMTFDFVEPTGKRFYVGLDVSGSMESSSPLAGISCAEAGAMLALTTVKIERQYVIRGFSGEMCDLGIIRQDSFRDVIEKTRDNNFGPTDCALPMIHALNTGIPIDLFLIITDNETWYGLIHPMQALREYRRKTGIHAKLCVLAMTANKVSIADPQDGGCLDIVGLDTSVPTVLAAFAL